MGYIYDPALVALSIATAMLGAFTALVVTAGISRVHASEALLRVLLAAAGIGSGIWATHFISLTAMALPVPPEPGLSRIALSAAIMIVPGGLAFTVVTAGRLGWMSFPLASLLFTAAMTGMHFLGFSALSNTYNLDFSRYGLVIALAIALQTSAAILWFSFHERALLGTFLGAAALGLAISATNYTMLEAVTLSLPDGASPNSRGPVADYSLALSVAGAIYAICGFCIGIFALVGSIKRAGPGGQHRVAG